MSENVPRGLAEPPLAHFTLPSITGLITLGWLYILASAIAGRFLFAAMIASAWEWWYAPAAALAFLTVHLCGLAVTHGISCLEYRYVRQGNSDLKDWYKNRTEYPDNGWTTAQRWIWTSPQAHDDFAALRGSIILWRDLAVSVLPLSLASGAAIVRLAHLKAWSAVGLALAALLIGLVLTWLGRELWIEAHRAYHRAVRDAPSIDTGVGRSSEQGGSK